MHDSGHKRMDCERVFKEIDADCRHDFYKTEILNRVHTFKVIYPLLLK